MARQHNGTTLNDSDTVLFDPKTDGSNVLAYSLFVDGDEDALIQVEGHHTDFMPLASGQSITINVAFDELNSARSLGRIIGRRAGGVNTTISGGVVTRK